MTADQIRSYTEQLRGSSSKSPEVDTIWVLSEIAAQLAELNTNIHNLGEVIFQHR